MDSISEQDYTYLLMRQKLFYYSLVDFSFHKVVASLANKLSQTDITGCYLGNYLYFTKMTPFHPPHWVWLMVMLGQQLTCLVTLTPLHYCVTLCVTVASS